MLTQLTIPKQSSRDPALDHAKLYTLGLSHVQRLAGRIWTDFNVHDPGVTILELLCYALTDLSYRASFPIQDLLASETNNAEEMKNHFFTARRILPNRPLTRLDYRKLLIDLKGVKNAWLEPAALSYYADTIKGKLFGPVAFFADEIIDLPGLAARLKSPADAVSEFLFAQFSPQARRVLAEIDLAGNETLFRNLLTRELNAVIHGPLIFESERFAAVTLPAQVQTLLAQKPQGDALARLNRMLLEETFPTELAKKAELRDLAGLPGVVEVPLSGLYEVLIEFMDSIDTEAEKEKVMAAVQQRLHENRNLGEDFASLAEVEVQNFLLCCELEVAPEVNVDQLQAEILFQVQHYLAPSVPNYPLSEMLDRKKPDGTLFSVDEIFNGPLLNCGFMDDHELVKAELRRTIYLSDIISIIMDIEGVRAVRDIVINPEGATLSLSDKWVIPVAPHRKALLNPQLSRFVFYKGNMPIPADPAKVRQFYSQQAAKARAKVETTREEDLAIPLGHFRHPAKYYSFQNHFPAIYGLSHSGLGSRATQQRQAQAFQLKAYLLFFDQLLANYFAQLSHLKDLWSTDPGLKRTYFTQLVDSFAAHERIYQANPLPFLEAILEDKETFADRRNRFLDHLIARFAEQFTEFAHIMLSAFNQGAQDLIAVKCDFLKNYPKISSERALAYNYTLKGSQNLWNSSNVSGLEKRLAKLLGLPNASRRDLRDSGDGMYLIEMILLRPELNQDPFLPICPDPNCVDCGKEDPYSYRIHIILPAYSPRFSNMEFRRYVGEVIRQETPAHILPRICWISQEDMTVLQKAYRDWISLKAGADTAQRADKLKAFFEILMSVRNVYPTHLLRKCDSPEDQPKFILGQTALGTQPPPA